MINKKVVNINDAISKIYNGSVILASGFGNAGAPNDLLEAITKTDINNLTIVFFEFISIACIFVILLLLKAKLFRLE